MTFSFLTLPASIASLDGREERANLALQHAMNELRGAGNVTDADELRRRWSSCGHFLSTIALANETYGRKVA